MAQGAFISYSHADVRQVQDLVDLIQKELGFSVWYDHNLHGGDHYFSVIAERILQYEYFIFVVSQNSVNSEFCTMELEFAKSEKRKILAVWLEDFMPPPRIRMVISHTHYIRCFALTDQGLRKELRSALLGERLASDVTVEVQPVSDRSEDSNKYFLREEEKKKIKHLLSLEAQGRYSICYEPDSAVLLGMAYEMGIHTEKDAKQAEFYYRVAAHKGSLDGEYLDLAMKLEQGRADLAPTIIRMGELAESGSILAMVYWGDDLYSGRYNVRPDEATAYRWWKIAAQTHPQAMYYLAFGYRNGEIGVKDPLLALMYAKEAQEAQFPRAYRIQGMLYRKGEFLEKDPEKAIASYQRAVELGDKLSLQYIGDVEWDRENFVQANNYYQQAVDQAEAGRIKSGSPYYSLGYSYQHGKGIEKNSLKAVELYLEGAKRNSRPCKRWAVAVIRDDIENPQQKYNLFKRASACNCRWAEYYLGRLLESQAKPNKAEALRWFNVGMDKGDVDCIRYVAFYYSMALGEEGFRDREKALAALRLFFSLWEENSEQVEEASAVTFNIVYYYYAYALELAMEGKGPKPDKELSLFYMTKALNAKDGMAIWRQCASIAGGYLDPEITNPPLDVPHGERILEEVYAHFPQYCQEKTGDKRFQEGLGYLLRDLELLIKHHTPKKSGLFSSRQPDEETAKKLLKYHQWADQVRKVQADTQK